MKKILLLPILKKHIEIINPKDSHSARLRPIKILTKYNDGMIKKRGKWLDYSQEDLSIPCFPILDPEFLLRRPEYKRETWSDIIILEKKIKELV